MRFHIVALLIAAVARPGFCFPAAADANGFRGGNGLGRRPQGSNNGAGNNAGNGAGTGAGAGTGNNNAGTGAGDENGQANAAQVLAVNTFVDDSVISEGFYGSPNPVQGGQLEVKTVLPKSFVGGLEVEYNGTDPQTITVMPKQATVTPPAGMMYFDPLSWVVSSGSAIKVGEDHVQMDYIFSKEGIAAADVSQTQMMKVNAADGTFSTDGLTTTFKAEIQELVSVADDMNGEWAILIPTDAVVAPAA